MEPREWSVRNTRHRRLFALRIVASPAYDVEQHPDALAADAHLAAFSAFAFPTLTFGWPFSFFHLGALPQSSIQASPS
jgi:hypothetical protein